METITMKTLTTWSIIYPWVSLPIVMYIVYTLFVNLLDETEGMFTRYVSAILFPWVCAYYLHISSLIMYGKSILTNSPF